MRALVTGGSGFLGRALCSELLNRGYSVRATTRDIERSARIGELQSPRLEWCPYFVEQGPSRELFAGGVDLLVHCGYILSRTAEEANVRGAASLWEMARQEKVAKIIFVSSLSALPDAASGYGRSKWQIEAQLDPGRDLALRPGLIIGAGGLYSRLSASISRGLPIPLFYGGEQSLYSVWIGDVVSSLLAGVERDLSGILHLASTPAPGIRDFYSAIAQAQGKRARFVHLPGTPSYWLLRAAEAVGLSMPVSSESLLGLQQMRTLDLSTDLARLGTQPIDYIEAIRRATQSA